MIFFSSLFCPDVCNSGIWTLLGLPILLLNIRYILLFLSSISLFCWEMPWYRIFPYCSSMVHFLTCLSPKFSFLLVIQGDKMSDVLLLSEKYCLSCHLPEVPQSIIVERAAFPTSLGSCCSLTWEKHHEKTWGWYGCCSAASAQEHRLHPKPVSGSSMGLPWLCWRPQTSYWGG